MQFGIWIEPEMVNPKSELFEKHPEWVLQEANRDKYQQRNQYVLDLSNPEVQQFIYNIVDNLLSENSKIAYIKWDCNSHFSNPGSTYLPKEKQQHVFIDYTLGLYKILDKIRVKYPNVIMQVCASGGGRVDYGSLPYFNEFWASDDTDAWQRIFIQWGTSHFFPAMAMASHVSAVPNGISERVIPIKFRFDVAMTGRLGMELQPSHMTKEEIEFSKVAVENYKRIRPIVQLGDLYRLVSPYESNVSSLMYVSKDQSKAVLFAYHLKWLYGDDYPNIKPKGLNPDKQYLVKEINKIPERKYPEFDTKEQTFSGDFLMNHGFSVLTGGEKNALTVYLRGEYSSAVYEITEIE